MTLRHGSAGLVRDLRVDEVVLSYSDLAHADVMHKASRALASACASSSATTSGCRKKICSHSLVVTR